MSENALVPVEMSWQDTRELGKVLAASKRFSDITNEDQAVVQVLAGREMGIGPIASMTGIYVINKYRLDLRAETGVKPDSSAGPDVGDAAFVADSGQTVTSEGCSCRMQGQPPEGGGLLLMMLLSLLVIRRWRAPPP